MPVADRQGSGPARRAPAGTFLEPAKKIGRAGPEPKISFRGPPKPVFKESFAAYASVYTREYHNLG